MRRRIVVGLVVAGCGGDTSLPDVDDPLDWIDPRIGTGGLGFAYGSSFVGAAVPHGLVKLGPDTNGDFGTIDFQHYSGYFADDDRIQSFSHLHLHGAGVADYGTLAVLPARDFDPTVTRIADYEARFSDERARPGSYSVRLGDIGVELVATMRGAHHRYDFGGGAGWIVVDLAKELGGDVESGAIAIDAAAGEITGTLHHSGGMSDSYGGYDLHFVIRARRPWSEHQVWADGPAAIGDAASGIATGAALRFDAGDPVELQVAVSLVSLDGARANLATELPTWDLVATRAAAEDAWRQVTGTVLVSGGTAVDRRVFYTSLYHAYLMPTVISDVDNRYVLAGVVEPQTGFAMSDFSLWDTYRTVQPVYSLLAPITSQTAAESLDKLYRGLGAYPRWPIAIGESGTMLGASADIWIADAIMRFGSDLATVEWEALVAAAIDPVAPPGGRGGREHVEAYMQYGYVPSSVGRSVSVTTEYSHDDFALANLVETYGDPAVGATLRERSKGWRALYDPAVGFLRARAADGSFAPASQFDPLELTDDYAEANAWHSLWMAGAHDPDGLIEILGGRQAAIDKLTTFFSEARNHWETADESAANFPRPYYWHGNEPDINAPFLFAQLGRPDLSQEWVRWVMTTHYNDTPAGVAGNDDGGTLGSWYVCAALGLYPIPGSDRWIIGAVAPLFREARLTRYDSPSVTIVAEGSGLYVANVLRDGVALAAPELTHRDLITATEIRFVLSESPTTWGRVDD